MSRCVFPHEPLKVQNYAGKFPRIFQMSDDQVMAYTVLCYLLAFTLLNSLIIQFDLLNVKYLNFLRHDLYLCFPKYS